MCLSKNLCLCVTVVSLIGAGALRAAPVSCLSVGTGSLTDSTTNFPAFTAPGFTCEQQDKIFSNFSLTSTETFDNSTSVRFSLQVLNGLDYHTVTLNGNFQDDLTFSYDIAVDPTYPGAGSALRIVRVSGDLLNPSNVGAPNVSKAVFTQGGTLLGTVFSSVGSPGAPLMVSETALHTVDTYTANGGGATAIANTFAQANIPEPMTNALVGSGLLLLGWSRRKRRA